MHSRDYRIPDDFIGRNVILVGRGPSGVDIALEIAETADMVKSRGFRYLIKSFLSFSGIVVYLII